MNKELIIAKQKELIAKWTYYFGQHLENLIDSRPDIYTKFKVLESELQSLSSSQDESKEVNINTPFFGNSGATPFESNHNLGFMGDPQPDVSAEMFKKVYIKSADDLPKETGGYFVFHSTFGVQGEFYNNDLDSRVKWLECFDYYLLPIASQFKK